MIINFQRTSRMLDLILLTALFLGCGKKAVVVGGLDDAIHVRMDGIWELDRRVRIDDVSGTETVTGYRDTECPTIVEISKDSMTQFETRTVAGTAKSSNCYFRTRFAYRFVPGTGLILTADTLGAAFAGDTLHLISKMLVRGRPGWTYTSMYSRYFGARPPAGTVCDCGDSTFTANSR